MDYKIGKSFLIGFLCFGFMIAANAQGQFSMTELSLEDLSAFQSTQQNWKIVGNVQAPMDKKKMLETTDGKGILVNQPDDKNKAQIFTQFEHGDIDLEFEVMMPAGSNSGVYLQGRYEIQLLDSWGKKRPSFADIGGIYQRWDDDKPKGQKGFEGTAPLTNAAKAPGLWQRMRISFQAPRFDAEGKKIKNARIIFVELNGVIIHQNVELTGPTRGPYVGNGDEAAFGPIVIQGDHGAVAFRNFKYRNFSGQPAQLKALAYKVVQNSKEVITDWSQVQPDLQGSDDLITWNVARADNEFSVLYEGQLEIPTVGDYRFELSCQGNCQLWIDGEDFMSMYSRRERKLKNLPKGTVPFRLAYTKNEIWRQAQLALKVEGKDFRPTNLHYESSALISNPTDPIFERSGSQARLLRSFVDFKMSDMQRAKKITNAINVGDPTGLHYTFDLNQGSLVQVWRGNFLDMTPMWYNRGNGVSVARGVVVPLTPNVQLMQRQSDGTLSTQFEKGKYRYLSYKVDEDNRPTFHYEAYGLQIVDQLMPNASRKSINRQLQMNGQVQGEVVFCLAEGKSIKKLDDGTYLIDDQYYIRSSNAAQIENLKEEQKGLIVPIKGDGTLEYTIVW
ncbi:MAG: family 16 glycoside hydrolase [Bacteroidota bacterium]